jgi:hypothetical protein
MENKIDNETDLVQFKIGYVTKKGNILLENNDYTDDNDSLLIDSNNNPFKVYILNFQTFEGGEAYLITNIIDKIIDIDKNYTITEIFNNFMKGYYFIGILHYYYKNNYKNGIITDVSTFDNEIYNEIILHYTKTRNYEGNIAWHTINWDLIEEFGPKKII